MSDQALEQGALAKIGAVLEALAATVAALAERGGPQPADRAMSLAEVAKLLSRRVNWVKLAIKRGDLKATRLGPEGKPVVLVSDFDAFLATRKPAQSRRVLRHARARRAFAEDPEGATH